MSRLAVIAACLGGFVSTAAAVAQEINEAALYEKNKTRIVKIHATIPDGNQAGTGVIISPEGHVLTALHVIGGSKDVMGRTITVARLDEAGRPTPFAGGVFVVGVEPNLDLAVLQLTGQYSYAEVLLTPLSGTPPLAAIIWNQGDNVPRPFSGKLNVPDPAYGNRLILALGAVPSNSGAPIFDAAGRVVAIMTNQKSASDPRFSLAAPLSSAERFLPTHSPEERQKCIDLARKRETQPKSFKREVEIQCQGEGPPFAKAAEFKVPDRNHTIAGLVSHTDNTNEYGWVGAVEYTIEEDGRVTAALIEVHCLTTSQSSKGFAKTVLEGRFKKLLSEEEQGEILRACITRR